MNGLILARLEKIEKKLKELKTLLKGRGKSLKTPSIKGEELTLVEIAKRLKNVGKRITAKEIADEIAAYRNQK